MSLKPEMHAHTIQYERNMLRLIWLQHFNKGLHGVAGTATFWNTLVDGLSAKSHTRSFISCTYEEQENVW